MLRRIFLLLGMLMLTALVHADTSLEKRVDALEVKVEKLTMELNILKPKFRADNRRGTGFAIGLTSSDALWLETGWIMNLGEKNTSFISGIKLFPLRWGLFYGKKASDNTNADTVQTVNWQEYIALRASTPIYYDFFSLSNMYQVFTNNSRTQVGFAFAVETDFWTTRNSCAYLGFRIGASQEAFQSVFGFRILPF